MARRVRGALTGAMTAGEVARAVGCDTNAAHAALVALLHDGQISCRNGKPNIWSPVFVVHEQADAPTAALADFEAAVLRELSATPITAAALAKRLFSRRADRRAKNVNPALYALQARGDVEQRGGRPPTWLTPQQAKPTTVASAAFALSR